MGNRLAALAALCFTACIDFDGLRSACDAQGLCTAGEEQGDGGAALRFDPTSASVNAQPNGASRQVTFVLFNDGDATAEQLSVGGCSTGPFTTASGCGANLASHGTCMVTVTFAPIMQGTPMCTLTATERGGRTAIAQVTGVATSLSVTPDPIVFAELELDAGTLRQQLTVRNTSSALLPMLNVGLTTTPSYTLENDQCTSFGLAPDAGCTVDVVFRPTTEGPHTATLNVTPLNITPVPVSISGSAYAAYDLTVIAQAPVGFVTGGDAGISCPSDCTEHLRRGRSVQLDAVADAGWKFVGWSGIPCVGAPASCLFAINAPITVQARFDRPNVMFVSSVAVSGAFGTQNDGGGRISCALLAADAGLAGTFVPLIQTDAGPPMAIVPASSRGWVRVDGQPIADSRTDFVNGRFFYPPDVTEHGVRLSGSANDRVWTGVASSHCDYFTNASSLSTGGVGLLGASGPLWLDAGGSLPGCGPGLSNPTFYCAEVGHAAPIASPPPVPTGARRAFLSASLYPIEPQGIADSRCQAEAAGLGGGAFVALRGYTDAGFSYLRLDAGAWYRVDGVKLFDQPADAITNNRAPLAAINVFADGGQLLEHDVQVWTGVTTTGNTITSSGTCNNWTGDAGTLVRIGDASAPWRYLYYTGGTHNCGRTARYYCFEN